MPSPLSRVLGVISPRFREPSTCEACGGPFVCGATLGGCWCAEIKTTDSVRTELRAKYKKCLCRACLERAAAGSL